jgi:hypothetical protein
VSTYDLEKLWSLWQRGKLTYEMVTGHVLQNLLQMKEALTRLQRTVVKLEGEVERLKGKGEDRSD